VQDTHTNGRFRVEQSDGQEFVFAVKDDGQFANGAIAILLPHTLGENPGMATAHNRFRRRCDAKTQAGSGR
jgi:hypothetical protein